MSDFLFAVLVRVLSAMGEDMTPMASAVTAPELESSSETRTIWLCFECDRFQRSPSPCIYCGSPAQELEAPPGAPHKGKTLLEVFATLEEGWTDCVDCGERWCLECEIHWAECSCPGPHGDERV